MTRVDTNSVFRSASAGVAMRLLRYPFFALFLVLVPRQMGPELYGRFALFLSVYMMLEPFVGLGNMQIFGRFLPEYLEQGGRRGSRLLHGMLFYGTVITLIVIGIATAVAVFFRPEGFHFRWLLILALILLLGKWQGTFYAYVYGQNQIARFSTRDLLRSASRVLFVLLLFHWFGLDGALWAFVVNELILVLISGAWVRRDLWVRPVFPKLSEFLPYIKFGLKFHLPLCLQALLQRSGNVIITLLAPASVAVFNRVTYYDIANQFVLMSASFFGILIATLVPSLTRFQIAREHARMAAWLNNVLSYCAALCVLIIIALIFVGPDVIALLGDEFDGVYGNAVWLSLSLFPLLINHAGGNLAVVKKQPGIFIKGTVSGLLLMLVMAALLTPLWAERGIVWSSVAGYTLTAVYFSMKYRSVFGPVLLRIGRVLGAGLLVSPAFLFQPEMLSGRILAGLGVMAVFVLLLVLFRIITRDHSRQVWTAMRRTQ